MARQFGLGVTPWSPLRSGFRTGKYTRDNQTLECAGRATFIKRNFHEAAFRVVDALLATAKDTTTPARFALAWVPSKPGVASPIIGARTPAQLEDNLASLEVKLSAEQVAALDAASRPVLNVPADDPAAPRSSPSPALRSMARASSPTVGPRSGRASMAARIASGSGRTDTP
jgi:aryl-alcohol dehydrogenase-like predicted oxidoreductase